jgi:hypothetical protein
MADKILHSVVWNASISEPCHPLCGGHSIQLVGLRRSLAGGKWHTFGHRLFHKASKYSVPMPDLIHTDIAQRKCLVFVKKSLKSIWLRKHKTDNCAITVNRN